MMDLETLSVRPNAVILVIGAIKFNRGETWQEKNITMSDIEKRDFFYTRIIIKSCTNIGLHIEASTEKWWKEQSDDVRHEAIKHTDRVPLRQALVDFKNWFGTCPRTKIWGNGSSFDCTILGEAYKRCEIDVPWKFWLERDLRTITDLGGIRMCDLPQYKKHHALFDCYRQIIAFQRAERNLGI